MSTSSSATISPTGRRAGNAIDPDPLDTCGRVTGRAGVARDGGELAGLCDCGRTSDPGGGVASGADDGGADVGGIEGGAYETGPCGITAGRAACCGYGASSAIFAVGARRACSPLAGCLAPQPPQNREFGSFSVPQVAQRIPAPA
jgi:hypothetical protein